MKVEEIRNLPIVPESIHYPYDYSDCYPFPIDYRRDTIKISISPDAPFTNIAAICYNKIILTIS